MQRSGRKVQRSRQKVQRSAASAQVGKGCSNNIQLQPPPPPPTRTNTAQCSNHSITATCVRVCKEFVCPYTSCSDCCILLCWSWSVEVVVVRSWMLLQHPLPTCVDACPDLCTLCPDLCTLHLWCYPSINQHKYTTCTDGGGNYSASCNLPH